MTPWRIGATTVLFKDAVRRAVQACYDGIELPAAHGYMLLGSFPAEQRNRCTDEYSGHSARHRIRVLQVHLVGKLPRRTELAADSSVIAEPDTSLFDTLVTTLPKACPNNEVHAAGNCSGRSLIDKATDDGALAPYLI